MSSHVPSHQNKICLVLIEKIKYWPQSSVLSKLCFDVLGPVNWSQNRSYNLISENNSYLTTHIKLDQPYHHIPWLRNLCLQKMIVVNHWNSQSVLKKLFWWVGDLWTHLRTEVMTKSVKIFAISLHITTSWGYYVTIFHCSELYVYKKLLWSIIEILNQY